MQGGEIWRGEGGSLFVGGFALLTKYLCSATVEQCYNRAVLLCCCVPGVDLSRSLKFSRSSSPTLPYTTRQSSRRWRLFYIFKPVQASPICINHSEHLLQELSIISPPQPLFRPSVKDFPIVCHFVSGDTDFRHFFTNSLPTNTFQTTLDKRISTKLRRSNVSCSSPRIHL